MPGLFTSALRSLPRLLPPLLENRCVSCSMPVPAGSSALPLCAGCALALFRREGGFCPRCGNLTALPGSAPALCGECITVERPWDALFFHGEYKGMLRELILRFKQGRELHLGHLLGTLLAGHPDLAKSTDGAYDAMVPLPLHPARLRERGFNQAVELAKPLAARLGTPILRTALTRRENTRPQAGLTRKERGDNVRNVFLADRQVRGLRLLLTDDIATTCASLESAARALLHAGAASVDVAVAARTPGPSA